MMVASSIIQLNPFLIFNSTFAAMMLKVSLVHVDVEDILLCMLINMVPDCISDGSNLKQSYSLIRFSFNLERSIMIQRPDLF
jgi:hypothetical protein